MDRTTAIAQIRDACRDIARLLMKIHPTVPHLADETAQHDSYQILHRLTVELESLKKRIGKLEREDASTEL
jgi:hypothetical protein